MVYVMRVRGLRRTAPLLRLVAGRIRTICRNGNLQHHLRMLPTRPRLRREIPAEFTPAQAAKFMPPMCNISLTKINTCQMPNLVHLPVRLLLVRASASLNMHADTDKDTKSRGRLRRFHPQATLFIHHLHQSNRHHAKILLLIQLMSIISRFTRTPNTHHTIRCRLRNCRLWTN